MEITKRAKTTTWLCGSAPAKGAKGVLEKYASDCVDKDLLSFAEGIKKKAQTVEEAIVDILSVFNTNGSTRPIIGSWMVRQMLVNTASAIFNKKDNKTHPSRAVIPISIGIVKPNFIPLFRGENEITTADFVQTYTVSIEKPTKRSFFKAYEVLEEGVEFDVTMSFNEDIMNQECIDLLLDNAQYVGLGAYRARFGKFEWI